MSSLTLALFLQPLLLVLPAQEAQMPTTQPATTGPALEVALTTMSETRRWAARAPQAREPESELLMEFKVGGSRAGEVVRVGRILFDELVDSTGQSLVKPEEYSVEEREFTRTLKTAEQLKQAPITIPARVASRREAKTIKIGRGTLRLVLATKAVDDVTIYDPLAWRGKTLDHPRLKELGVEIMVLPPGDPAQVPPNSLPLRFAKGLEQIKSIMFFDGAFQEIRSTQTPARTNDNQLCFLYQPVTDLDEDTQLVIQVYKHTEDLRCPFTLENVELP